MSKMFYTNVNNCNMNETEVYNESLLPSRCPVVMTCGPDRHQATAQKKWWTQDNICVKSARCERI